MIKSVKIVLLTSLVLCSVMKSMPCGKAAEGDAVIDSISYLYGGSTSIYINNINRTNGNLSIVCPDYFEIDSTGNVILSKKPDPFFVETAHKMGIKVTPFVSNHWNQGYGRKGVNNAAAVAGKLAAWVEQYDFDGIDIDIENLDHTDKAAFTTFIKTMRAQLPKDKILSVCVAANPWDLKTGWQGQYDLAELSNHCDTIFIMTYDENYDGDTSAGPVGSYAFVENSIKTASKYVPTSKLMVGIPFYGRYWNIPAKIYGKAFTISDIENLVSRYDSDVWYDSKNECARATLRISEATNGMWGGKKLEPGTYDIWYENEKSFEKKLSLVKKYNLKGAGSWALGQEPASIWTNYYKWLYGLPFTDIAQHWGEGAIAELYARKIVSGTSGGKKYEPDNFMTRAEACVLICKLINADLSQNSLWYAEDVKEHWAKDYLMFCIQRGIMQGKGNDVFAPDEYVTRQEMAVLLCKVLNVSNAIDFNEQHFDDVTTDMWSNNAIITLKIFNVVQGYNNKYYPTKTLTRAEAASMIYKMLDLPLEVPIRQLRYYHSTPTDDVIEPR